MKKKDTPIGFRLTKDNKKLLKEIEQLLPTVDSRNAAMNHIIKNWHCVVVVPRKKKIAEIKADMRAYSISISDLTDR